VHRCAVWAAGTILVVSCQPSRRMGTTDTVGDPSVITEDPWVRVPGDDLGELTASPAQNVRRVSGGQLRAAIALLETRSCLELDPAAARSFWGAEYPDRPGLVAVLFRCVQPTPTGAGDEARDRLTVESGHGVAAVTYAGTRQRYTPLRHGAVIALLPSVPRDVYVRALVAID
jgi:hypothetical protein